MLGSNRYTSSKVFLIKGSKLKEVDPNYFLELCNVLGVAGANVSGSCGGEVIWIKHPRNNRRLHSFLIARKDQLYKF